MESLQRGPGGGGFLEEVCGASKENNTRFQDSPLTTRYRFSLGTCMYSCMYLNVSMSMCMHPSYGVWSSGLCPKGKTCPR